MTAALDDLTQSLENRVASRFLSAAVLAEVTNAKADRENVMQTVILFYRTCINYLDQWKEQFEDVRIFDWARLNVVPEWKDVDATIKFMVEKKWLNADEDNIDLFDEFGYVLKFVTADKIVSWNQAKGTKGKMKEKIVPVKSHLRWVECFKHFESNNVPYSRFARIIAFIFSLPATSASVERVFSFITKLWTKEKSQLEINTLKYMLFVKYNLKYTCTEFYDFLKGSPSLLNEIISQEKYDFKQKKSEESDDSD